MKPERCQTCKVMISWSMLSIEKKIICKQRRYVNYLSKFKRFPLETTKLHRRWFALWRLNMATVSKPSQIFTLHYEVKSWHHAKFELFLTYFTFSLFSETKKSIFEVVPHNVFAYCPSDFSCIRHPHVEKTIREIFLQ